MANRNLPYILGATTTAIPFDQPTTYIPAKTITGATTFSKVTANAQVSYGAILRVVADGTNLPDFSAFKKVGTGNYVNTAGIVNQCIFYFDGVDYCVAFNQPTTIAGGGGGGDTTPPTIVSAVATDGTHVTVVFSETVVPTVAGWGLFVTESGLTYPMSSVSGSGTTWIFVVGGTMLTGQTLGLIYTSASGNTLDTSGNELSDVSNFGVTNSIGGGGSYDTDAQAIIDAKTAAGVAWSTTKQDGVNAFVTGLKTDGLWTKVHQMGNLSDGSFAKCKINWKSPGTKDLSSSNGTVTYGATGSQGNGTTGYINTGIVPNTEFANSYIHLGIYCRTTGSTAVTFDMGTNGTNPVSGGTTQAMVTAGWGTARTRIDNGGLQVDVTHDSRGFFVGNRSSDTSLRLYIDGSSAGEDTTDDSNLGLPPFAIFLHAYNNAGTADLYSDRELSFWIIGTSLTPTEAANLNTRFQALKTAFGW